MQRTLATLAATGLLMFASAVEAQGRLSWSPREATAHSGALDTVAVAERWLRSHNPTGAAGYRCADFVTFFFRRSGRRPLPSRMTASALAYGPLDPHPRHGDLVVVSTGAARYGHVGLLIAVRGDRVEIISGNWSGRVARAIIARSRVAAFVRA